MNFIKNLFKKEKTGPIHDWKFGFERLTKDHKQKDKVYSCKDCGEYRHEFESVQEPIEDFKKDDPNAACWCNKCGRTLIGGEGESLCGDCA